MKTQPLTWHSWPLIPHDEDFPVLVHVPHARGLELFARPNVRLHQALNQGGHWSQWRILEQPPVFPSRDPNQRMP